MDWFNLLFIASATSAILGLTWGGVAYEWSSYHVLLPLIAGLAGIILFVYLERFTTHPTVPYYVFTHWNSIVGNLLCFLHSITVLAILYYYPIYLQSVVGDSAVQSGVHTFNLSLCVTNFSPFSFLTNHLVQTAQSLLSPSSAVSSSTKRVTTSRRSASDGRCY